MDYINSILEEEIGGQVTNILLKYIPTGSSTIASSHMWLFELRSIKLK